MLENAKNYASRFVSGLKNDEDVYYEFGTTSAENAAWICGNVTRTVGIGVIATTCLLGVMWEHRWLHGNLQVFDKTSDKWYDYKSFCKYIDSK